MSSSTYQTPGVYVEEVASAQQPIAGVGTNVVGFIGVMPRKIYIPVPNPDYDPVVARAAHAIAALAERRAQLQKAGKLDAKTEEQIQPKQDMATQAMKTALDAKDAELAEEKRKLAEAEAEVTATKTALDTANTEAEQKKTALDNATDEDKREAKQASTDANRARSGAQDAHQKALDKADELSKSVDNMTKALNEARAAFEAASAPPPAPAPAPAPAPDGQSKPGATADEPIEAPLDDEAFENRDVDAAMIAPSFLRPYILQEFEIKVDPFETKFCTNFTEYTQRFGTFSAYKGEPDQPYSNPDKWIFSPYFPGHHALTHAVNGFFKNGGTKAYVARIEDAADLEKVLEKFRSIDDLAIIAAPGLPRNSDTWEALMSHAENRENCFAILDAPDVVNDGNDEDLYLQNLSYSSIDSLLPRPSKNAAFYFPHIEVVDPAKQLQDSDSQRKVGPKYRGRTYVAPSGHIAGIYARTDEERGVHKAPANCVVRGALEVKYYISKPIQAELNPQGVNALRIMNNAVTVWGARTIGGDANGEWKYVPVRRLFLFLQKSIELGTQWIVFEPNDEALWGKIRLNITAFLTNVWRTGALFGTTPDQAFYVKCDAELNPPEVRDVGQVITEIGVAIVRPAEFVIFRITQSTGTGQS
ncbi:phage tail sheath C-terminal domain-containing protein [Paraburkholderia sp. BR13444]|uniref:phage tail sheath C-terminal domain-containing protein n=1 Tax=Paraburkholderia sp. BR13444 TaxID=3236997 RepID=UPI0034CFC1DB